MATYRVIWEFNENDGATFQEVYYREAGDANEACKLIPTLQATRLNLLNPLNTFVRIRSSNVAQSRDTGLNNLRLPGTFTSASGPLPAGATVILSLATTSGASRKLWLRGCSASAYTRDATTGKDILTAYMDDATKAFFAALQRAGYGIRKLTPAASNPASPYFRNPIVSVDGTVGNGTSVLTYKQPIIYAPGSRVVIGGTSKKDTPSLNGHFSVIAQSGLTVTLPYATPNDLLVLKSGGYIRQETYGATVVFDASICGFGNLGTRDTKSPLSHSRGARRAGRLRLSR